MGVCMAGASDADVGDYEITESTGPMKEADAPTATVFDDAGLGYAVQSDGSLMLVSVPSDAVHVVVPAYVNDNGTVREVTRLLPNDINAFVGHKSIQTIDFENKKIVNDDLFNLFGGCTGLTAVTLPETWKNVIESQRGFYGCENLRQITLTKPPAKIGRDALYGTPTPIYILGLTSEQVASMNSLSGAGSGKFEGSFIVTFNANGGDAIAPVQGLTVTLPTDATRAPTEDTTYKLAYFEAADGTQYKPGETIDLTQTGDLNLTVRWYATTTTGGYNGPGAGTVDKLSDALPVIVIAGIVAAVAIGMMIVGRDDRNHLGKGAENKCRISKIRPGIWYTMP